MVLELVRCEFLLRRENVLLLGNSGTGKTPSRSGPKSSAPSASREPCSTGSPTTFISWR
jgi:hypothetical protein